MSIRQAIHFLLMTSILVTALAGCAAFDDMADRKNQPPVSVISKKPAPKDLGSLWSEDSMWNYVYTAGAARVPGDIITLRLDDSFKKRVTRIWFGGDIEREKAVEKAAESLEQRSVASAGTKEGAEKPAETGLILRGSIEEVGPRGVYRIAASDSLRLGLIEPYLVLRGRVRDRDIDGNDEVNVADVVDLSFDVLKTAPIAGGRSLGANHVSW